MVHEHGADLTEIGHALRVAQQGLPIDIAAAIVLQAAAGLKEVQGREE